VSNPSNRNPPYGDSVVSWRTIDQELNPDIGPEPEFSHLAADMNRLRGLIMAQCGETEAVLGMILAAVAPTIDPERKTAGQLLECVSQNLPDGIRTQWQVELDQIRAANRLRNQAVHSDVHVGSTWVEYQTGGGHFEPVISLMRHGEYSEADLLVDLAVQQHATVAAVRLLHATS
jgi:hypothetical protein